MKAYLNGPNSPPTAEWNDDLRVYYDYVEGDSRPYTDQENADADARVLAATQQAVQQTIYTEARTDLTKLRAAIDAYATLLGDNTTEGSLRQWRSQDNSVITSAAGLKDLVSRLIPAVQADRAVAREALRLAKIVLGDYQSADVGTE